MSEVSRREFLEGTSAGLAITGVLHVCRIKLSTTEDAEDTEAMYFFFRCEPPVLRILGGGEVAAVNLQRAVKGCATFPTAFAIPRAIAPRPPAGRGILPPPAETP